jgi:nitrate/TMAO reductase-like tetraheme cytochrome c subunit
MIPKSNLSRGRLASVVFLMLLSAASSPAAAKDPHAAVFRKSDFPSASQCRSCHKKIYEEWRSSAHAYAAISPVFHKFEQAINNLAPTIGSFCVRCHIGVGTTLGEPRQAPIWARAQVSREGVTCISCHRVDTAYNKVNGERRIVPGNIHQPVYGNTGGPGLRRVVRNPKDYRVATNERQQGAKIHRRAIRFRQIRKSEFCVSCHQVAVNLGIKLEVVWEQYRNSPAFRDGITCQNCHMSERPGRPTGYVRGPAAIVVGQRINPRRRHHNHAFVGPGYSIAHPGIFPHNPEAARWKLRDWLKFDWRAGWGDPDWEDRYEDRRAARKIRRIRFPRVWRDRDTREAAREVIVANLAKLEEKRKLRRRLLEAGSRIDGPFFDDKPRRGSDLKFSYRVTNRNRGHNLPSGSLGAQPEIWLNVVLTGPHGKRLWESGDVDSNGDMRDLHSADVAAGKVPLDDQLFNLQTKFLTTNVKGTDREMYLPVQFDFDQLPFLRPPAQPVSVMNHPPFVRMEGRSLPPLGSRDADYSVPARYLKRRGKYKLSVRLRSRAEPIYFMKFIGSTPEMIRSMNADILDIHPYTVEFYVR